MILNFLEQVGIVVLFLFEQLFNIYVAYNEQEDKIKSMIFPKWLIIIFAAIPILFFIKKVINKIKKER